MLKKFHYNGTKWNISPQEFCYSLTSSHLHKYSIESKWQRDPVKANVN